MIRRDFQPYSVDPSTQPLIVKQAIVAEYEAFINRSDLKPEQKSGYQKQFSNLVETIEPDLQREEEAREKNQPHANLGWHNRRHFSQTTHDDINVAEVLLEKDLVPAQLAYELPQNGYGHDWAYLFAHLLGIEYPTHAHLIKIHVEKTLGGLVRWRRSNMPSFYNDQEKRMSLYGTALATHATHFRDPDTMLKLQQKRNTMIEKFAEEFGNSGKYEYHKQAAIWLARGAQLGDLAQTAMSYYMKLLPGLRWEMNDATPPGKPPLGDLIIGKTAAEMSKKGDEFISRVILEGPVGKTAVDLFGPENTYTKTWRELLTAA